MNRARVQRRGLRGPRTVFLVAFLVAAFLAQLSVTARGGSAETTTGQPSDEHTFGHQTQEQGSASGEDQHSRHAFSHLRLGRPGRGSGLSSQRFPEDLYAQPAFKIIYDDQNPVRNASALDFLQASSSDLSLRAPTAEAALVAGQGCAANPSLTANGRGPGTHQLIRSSRDTVHLCHIPTPRTDLAHEALYSSSAYLHQILHNASGTSDARQEEIAVAALESERKRIIAHGLTLLEPLKNYCLYQTADWFTYAFCHGRSIRQFKALPPATAVNVAATQQQKAHQAGASSTLSEEEQRRQRRQAQSQIVERQLEHGQIVYEVKLPSELAGTNFKALIPPQEPIEDKDSDAYVLGRWNRGVETIAGTKLHFTEWERGRSDDEHPRRRREVRKGTIEDGSSHKLAKDEPAAAIMHDRTSEATSAASGTELMEVTRFGAGEEQRYLAQPWTDGTRCKVNGEPRMTEVQYHCNRKAKERIALIKEVTTCNYVIVIETPRLCEEPAFLVGQDEHVNEIHCRPIVADDWVPLPAAGATASGMNAKVGGSRKVAPSIGSVASAAEDLGAADAEQEQLRLEKEQRRNTHEEALGQAHEEGKGSYGQERGAQKGSPQDGQAQVPSPSQQESEVHHQYPDEALLVMRIDENGAIVLDTMTIPSDQLEALGLDTLLQEAIAQGAAAPEGHEMLEIKIEPTDLASIRRQRQAKGGGAGAGAGGGAAGKREPPGQREQWEHLETQLRAQLTQMMERDRHVLLQRRKKPPGTQSLQKQATVKRKAAAEEEESDVASAHERMKVMSELFMRVLGIDPAEERQQAQEFDGVDVTFDANDLRTAGGTMAPQFREQTLYERVEKHYAAAGGAREHDQGQEGKSEGRVRRDVDEL